MGTVILKWNPGFSSYTMIRFLGDLEKCALSNNGNADMNWSIWEFDKVHAGDRCFMLKVGYGQTGIVARGTITSEPYSGEDWSWRGRPTKYCNFIFDTMINPDAYPILSSSELSKTIPDFDWNGGHSGMVLNEEQAKELDRLWKDYMSRQAEYFDKASDQNFFQQIEAASNESVPYSMEIDQSYRGPEIVIKSKEGEESNIIRIGNYHRALGTFGVKSWRGFQKLLYTKYPSSTDLQALCADLFHNRVDFEANFYTGTDPDDDE